MEHLPHVMERTTISARDTKINKNKALALYKFIYCIIVMLLNGFILWILFNT